MSNVAAGKDIDDEGETLNDVETALNKQGIALRSSQHEWRNFEDVLEEVAEKWKNWNDDQQGQVATAIAGVRQQENFRALMNNWDEVGRLAGVAADSTGSASKRMETYLDSIEAKTNNLKASWENFVMSLNQSESWGQMLDMLSNVLDKLTYVDWEKVITVLTIFASLAAATKIIGAIGTAITAIKTAITAGGAIAGVISAASGLLPVLLAISGVVAAIAIGWQSVNENAEANLAEIEDRRKALDKEEESATELIKRYNELKAKQGVYGLSQKEKQELVDTSTELVKVYGLEYDGIDSLTGAYNIASGAVDKYTESLKLQREEFSKQAREERRKDIDDRLSKLSWNDTEFVVAETNRKLGKDFDVELYYSYIKEREAIITKIQDQMAEIFSEDLSNSTKNLILEQINVNASNLSGEEIRNKYTDTYLAQLNDFASEYDNVIQEVYDTEEKFKKKIDEKGVLSLTETEDYREALENRVALYKELQKQGLISTEEYQAQVSALEKEVNSRLDFAFLAISEGLGKNADKFNQVASSVLGLTTELKNGEKELKDYVTQLGELAENLDLKDVFGDNTEASLQFFSTLSTQLTNVLNIIKSNYEGGLYASNNDYINDLIAWGEGLQMVGNKMKTIEGGEVASSDNSVSTDNENRIATVKKDDATMYIMERSTYDAKQKEQNTLATIKSVWDGITRTGTIDYETLQKLTGKVELKNVEGYDYFYDKAKENKINGLGYGLTEQDFINYFKDSKVSQEIIDQFTNLLNEEKKTNTTEEKDALWKNATNKYNSENTQIIENDTELITQYENKVKELNETLAGYNKRVKEIEETAEKVREKHPDKTYKNNGMTLKEKAELEGLQQKIKETNEEIEKYQNKIKEATSEETTFETAVEETSAEIENQGKETSNAANEIANAIKNLKDMQDSISAIEGINTGKIVEGTEEYSTAITTIITDTVAQMRDANGEIKENYKKIFGETSILYTGTMEQIQGAFQEGKITLEQFQEALKQEIQGNINALKNGIGQFLIDIGKQFEKFEVTLKITMNTGNIADKIKNAIAGITGQDINVGEIKIASDAISNTLSTLGNSIKSTPLEFDFSYMPMNVSGSSGGGSPSKVMSPSGGSGGSSYTAEDAASDLKDILQDIEGYEADIELDLEDQTEQLINQYNLKRNQLDALKEELDYYDSIYDSTEETTKWLETQLDILDNQSQKISEMEVSNDKIAAQREKIYRENSQYNVKGWFDSEGNATLAYGDLINSFEYRKNAIEKETAAAMRQVYNSVAGSTNKDTIQAAKDKIKQIEEEGDIKIKALEKEQEKVENIYDSVEQLNDAWKENEEQIREALEEMNSKVKEIRDELLDDITEQLEKAVDRMNTSIEKDVTRLEQLKQVQESYNGILNDTIDTQQELEDELQANMDSYQYLDEDLRQLMFNEEDYKQLSGILSEVQEDIADIWEDHYNQINSLTEDEMYMAEYITNETERQLALKQQEYEIAKAELDVAKAKTNLQNVKAERNTRIFANGEWQWVADPDAVKSAQQQLADAERAKDKIEREQEQQLYINELDRLIDSDNLQIDKNNQLLENIQAKIEEELTEVKNIEDALKNATGADLPSLNSLLLNAFGSNGGAITELLGEINTSQRDLALLLQGTSIEQANAQLKSGKLSQSEFESLLSKMGYSFDPVTGEIITKDGRFKGHYQGWKPKSIKDTQTGTAENGVQVTGNGVDNGSGNGNGNPSGNTFPRQGTVRTNSLPLRIRSGAGTQYKVLGSMPKGASVTILGEANSGWAKVKYGNITGYSSRQYLSYDAGGVASGIGYMAKATLEPERVLSPRQTKAFENLVKNMTTNPIMNILTRNPEVVSKLTGANGNTNNSKIYNFSNFTVQANNIKEFIDSIETIMPMSNK